jgi:Kef-type K+ transport system membrane component KefB/nucleotide-binding universal stress UspA family protein
MLATITPLPGHAVFLLLVQLALLLLAARAGAELARRVGLPAVVGELAAGIVLGPSVIGHYAPEAFRLVFPAESAQFHLLETVGTLGMVLLLLLTGLETDLRLLRNLGRAALVASAMGMLVPFAFGFGLGMFMPDEYLAQPDQRVLFSAFLATAMAISAMPVIAKILMDLDLTRRNIGLVILSAGVVDDTAGWLILSVIAGAAKAGGAVELGGVAITIALMFAFLAVVAFVLYPALKLVFRVVARFKTDDSDLVLIVVVTLLCAAVTEWIGVHAVFGAFICGTALRQVTHLREEAVHRLESFVFAILAPVFFGIVGLKVDLWMLGQSGGGTMLGIVLGVACGGKLIGCTIGGLWGGMQFGEALAIAVAMNARGAMELVVATIGLSLGILNPQMFSIIVVVAIVTSFMAPLGLRLAMRLVRMTEDEAKRILAEETRGAFDVARLRALVPTAGGPNAIEAARIALTLCRRSESPVHVLFVDVASRWWQRPLFFLRKPKTGHGLEAHTDAIRQMATGATEPKFRRVTATSVGEAILDEARRGFDVVLIGATGEGLALGGKILEDIVAQAPCHVAIARAGRPSSVRRVLVPVDGSVVSRVAVEFAITYCEQASAELVVAMLLDRAQAPADVPLGAARQATPVAGTTLVRAPLELPAASPAAPVPERGGAATYYGLGTLELSPREELERISPLFKVTSVQAQVLHLQHDASQSAILQEIEGRDYELVVLGVENRAIRHRMFFGYENERLIRKATTGVVVVIPNLGRLK